MGERAEQYEKLLADVAVQKPLPHTTLDIETTIQKRDAFFESIKTSLEGRLSHLAIDRATGISRVIADEDDWGAGDVIDILTLDGWSPIAYARQTIEQGVRIVRFGTMPIDAAGERLLSVIEEADQKYSEAIFHG